MRPLKFAIIPYIWVCSDGHRYIYTFRVGRSSVVFSGSSYRCNKRKWPAHTYEADVTFTSTGMSNRGRVPMTNTYFLSPILFCIPIPDYQKLSAVAYLTLFITTHRNIPLSVSSAHSAPLCSSHLIENFGGRKIFNRNLYRTIVDLSGYMLYGLEHSGNVLCVDMLFRCNMHSEALSCCKKLAKSQFLLFTCPAGTEWPEQIYTIGIVYFHLLLNPRSVLSYFMPSTCAAALIIQSNSHTTCHIISN